MTKKSAKKKITRPPGKTIVQGRRAAFVTLWQIEKHHPCEGAYEHFLLDFSSNVCDPDNYPGVRVLRKSRYGADDPIPLADILTKKSSSGMSGSERVSWLIERVPSLAWIAKEKIRIRAAIEKQINELHHEMNASIPEELVAMITGKKAK